MNRRNSACPALACSAFALLAGGCPQEQQENTTGDSTSLTATEQEAIAAAIGSIESLTSAGSASQFGTDLTNGQSSLATDCPAVDFQSAQALTQSVGVTIDFGTGCDAFGSSEVSCSGSTIGTLDVTTQSVNLTFSSLTCNGNTINGDAELQFDSTTDALTMTGDFDLFFSDDEAEVNTDGDGSVEFNRTTGLTTIPSFAGTMELNGTSYTLSLENIQMSVDTYDSFIPVEGQAVLTAANIRTLTMQFTAASPVTGEVQVSLDGSAFVTVNIFEL